MNPRVLGILLLLGIALSGWALWSSRDTPRPTIAAPGRSAYVLHDFQLVALDKQGLESFTLTAPLLQETPGAKTLDLTTPVFLLPDKQGQSWNVRSNTAWVNERQDEIHLQGDVVATSPSGATTPVTMKTEQLKIFPNNRVATTDGQVEVIQPGITMRGVGMQADLVGKRVQLLSQVKTRYASNR